MEHAITRPQDSTARPVWSPAVLRFLQTSARYLELGQDDPGLPLPDTELPPYRMS
jgi:hypothetical protein